MGIDRNLMVISGWKKIRGGENEIVWGIEALKAETPTKSDENIFSSTALPHHREEKKKSGIK